MEGIHHVGEAVEAGWEVESILYAPELLTSAFARDLISRLGAASQPVSTSVMESIADKDNPQGLVAIVHQKQTRIDELKLSDVPGGQTIRWAAALVSPQDPGNVGTILRTLDAVGADALFLLDGGVEPYHPTAVRSSMGTIFWKPVIQTSFDEFVSWARNGKYQLIGTSAHGDVGYQTLVPQMPWILVLGSEQKGLSTAQTNACDVAVSLPMKGRVSSLNLAVAAGVLLYQYCVGQMSNLPTNGMSPA
ncbi:MAG TPA: RNA methyltransferase [Anaerolineales bacterium]|nr:RNA methyltransferase [Anaerolineales bacterium]